MKFRVRIETDEDGAFVAECPTLPGCISQGTTRNEAINNIKDAIAGYLASLENHQEPVPLPIEEEVVEAVARAGSRRAQEPMPFEPFVAWVTKWITKPAATSSCDTLTNAASPYPTIENWPKPLCAR
jgi:antitoxin HicB